MKERPIIFSGEMVRAILRDKDPKTVTRRIIKIQPPSDEYILSTLCDCTASAYRRKIGKHCWLKLCEDGINIKNRVDPYFSCPYGKVGDRLWVKETHLLWRSLNGQLIYDELTDAPIYADDPEYEALKSEGKKLKKAEGCGWEVVPSIFMSRESSRITLEITKLWPERLKEITDEQAIKEGITFSENEEVWPGRATIRFQELWDSINAKRGYPFCDNPWVWVVEFKKVEQQTKEEE